jgi:hypothetical protein
MTDMKRVVILDDDESRARQDWAARISKITALEGIVEVEALSTLEVAECLRQLEERSIEARADSIGPATQSRIVLDDADIVIIDYDLTPDPARMTEKRPEQVSLIKNELRAETAETVAYLARCYSSCKFIVAVNQSFQSRAFDTTFMRFVDSWADLNISQDDVASVELWTGKGGGFHPWSWPLLVDAGQVFDRRVSLADLDTPVLDALGLLPADEKTFDVRQLDVLSDQPDSVTFRDIARSSELGLALRDKQPDDIALRRIAAAGIGRWLDRVIFQAQNILVDAPHLAYRMPSLLTGDRNHLSSWNAVAILDEPLEGLDLQKLSGRKVNACDWFDRPMWFWPSVSSDESIPEVASPWRSERYDFVFCEDTSAFAAFGEAHEVRTDLPGPYDRRYIRRLRDGNVSYVPRQRIVG